MSIATLAKPQISLVGPVKPQEQSFEEPSFVSLEVTDKYITACFSDDRIVSVPLWWSWRLEQATQEQRSHYQIIGAGRTVYWPDVDEHLSTQGFFTGTPAPRPRAKSAKKNAFIF